MSSQEQTSPLFWWPNILVMAMMAVGILTKPQSLTSARPTGTQGSASDLVQLGQRLWEDPLPLHLTKKSEPSLISLLTAKPATTTLEEQLTNWLKNDVTSDDDRVCIMFVHLPPGGYAEEEERRMRFRYAMQAATGYAGYKADDLKPMEIKSLMHEGTERTVAKEVFHPFSPEKHNWLAKKYGVVVVMYLSDFLFERKMANEALQPWRRVLAGMERDFLKIHAASKKNPTVDFHIMGPSNSDRLVDLCTDLCLAEANPGTQKLVTHGEVCFHACLPTLTSEILMKLAIDGAPDEKNKQQTFNDASRELLSGKKKITATRLGATLTRVAGDDHDLCQLLYEELANRGVRLHPATPTSPAHAPASAQKNNEDTCLLAIISEWDTTYGRSLPLTFNEVIKQNAAAQERPPATPTDWSWNWEHQAVETRTLCRFSYVRGLDGQLPDDPAKSSGGSHADKDNVSAVDRPQGRSQADYVHRIVERMQAIEQKEGRAFRAIGILGSDVYDKLMILRALRPAFQHAIFFTTDLDAAMADASEYDWSQNLIVASRFGLRVNEAYQGWSPPFREGYQTGFYLSSLEALGATYYNTYESNRQHLRPVDWDAPPLLFEIGRNGPWQLTPSKTRPVAEVSFMMESIVNKELNVEKIPKASPQPPPLRPHSGLTLPLSLTFLTFIVAIFMTTSMRREQRLVSAPRSSVAIFLFNLFLGWFWIVGIIGWWLSETEEPFLFWNGISIWPSALLHATIPCLCIHYLWTSWLILGLNRESIQHDFGSSGLLTAAPGHAQNHNDVQDLVRENEDIRTTLRRVFSIYSSRRHMAAYWRSHSNGCGLTSCLFRTMVYYVVYELIMFLCFLSLPHMHSDLVRGHYSRMLTTHWVPFMALVAFLILLFYAVDACLACGALLRTAIRHVSKMDVHEGAAAAHEVRRLIKLCASRGDIVASFIYYPFIVLFILITARHRVLDGFDWPLTAVLTYASSLLILVIITTMLQSTANRLKKVAIRMMETGKEFASGHSNGGENEAARPDDVASYEATLQYLQGMNSPVFSTVYSNPIFRAVLIPLGGTGALHGLDLLGSMMK